MVKTAKLRLFLSRYPCTCGSGSLNKAVAPGRGRLRQMAHRKPEGEGGYARVLSKHELARSWMVMGNNSPVGMRAGPNFKHAPTRSPSRTNNQKRSTHMVRLPPAHHGAHGGGGL